MWVIPQLWRHDLYSGLNDKYMVSQRSTPTRTNLSGNLHLLQWIDDSVGVVGEDGILDCLLLETEVSTRLIQQLHRCNATTVKNRPTCRHVCTNPKRGPCLKQCSKLGRLPSTKQRHKPPMLPFQPADDHRFRHTSRVVHNPNVGHMNASLLRDKQYWTLI